jgi:hypothetical protein
MGRGHNLPTDRRNEYGDRSSQYSAAVRAVINRGHRSARCSSLSITRWANVHSAAWPQSMSMIASQTMRFNWKSVQSRADA